MLNTKHLVTGVSLSHATTNVRAIEPLTVTSQEHTVERLLAHDGVHEAYVLHTCSRVEAYVVTETTDAAEHALNAYLAPLPNAVTGDVQWLTHENAIMHLMRVAAGLESIVTGEDHVLGQLKNARKHATEAGGLTGDVLEPAVSKAIRVGEQARTETHINDGHVSISSAAAAKASEETSLNTATVLVIGAGDIAAAATRHIAADAHTVIMANRTRTNAERIVSKLPDDVAGDPATLDELPDILNDVSVVISATASESPVIESEDLAGVGQTTILDIAQPADLSRDAEQLEHITTVRLHDLMNVTDEAIADRDDVISDVEALIETAFDELLTQYKRERADDVISGMRQGAAYMKSQELQEAFTRLEAADGDLTDEQRAIITDLADALVNELLAAPTESLRDAAEHDDWTTLRTAIDLFDPTDTGPNPLAETLPDDIPTPPETDGPAADSDPDTTPSSPSSSSQ